MREYWENNPDSETSLRAWARDVRRADWETTHDIRNQFASASFVRGNRVVFNIAGNRYRLVVWVQFRWRTVYVKWVGTHLEYDRIDAERVGL